jgi:hypothetical protein
MQQDFIESNAAKKYDNLEKKKRDQDVKYAETYRYFPFNGSDEVE